MGSSGFLPAGFEQRMQGLLGSEYTYFRDALCESRVTGLRVNTLKITPQEFEQISPFPLEPLQGVRAAYLVGGEEQPGRHPYHAAGLYYLQDPSAMVAAGLLDPQPGERVLDLSAAPGGKATQIAALMQDQGLLAANEVDRRRIWELVENMERWGCHNAALLNGSPERMADRLEGFFDRVLLDAPCSGEGMFWKSEAARQQWSEMLVQSCAVRQSGALDHAGRLVRPGGRLVYATCTFEPDENEQVIAAFLRRRPDFELVEVEQQPGFSGGNPEWASGSASLHLERTVRLWPQRGPGGGQFIAVLQRNGDSNRVGSIQRAAKTPVIPKAITMSYAAIVRQVAATGAGSRWVAQANEAFVYRADPETGELPGLLLDGSYLYQVPPGLPDLHGLNAVRPGWWLGAVHPARQQRIDNENTTMRKAHTSLKSQPRFEPSHALAAGLHSEDIVSKIDLPAGHPQVNAYLRGESFASEGEDNWVLVCVDGYPLGWGKRVKGVMKNHYPRGLRK
ncbi:MAG: RsmB/NOP family class I SAM-dependent RNA methyltransferase [Omnitrophica WOR_2 bacterium]